MSDLNVDSFRSVSAVNKSRMQKDREKTEAPSCFGFRADTPPAIAIVIEADENEISLTKELTS